MGRLLLLFVIVPVVELVLMDRDRPAHRHAPTLDLSVVTGALGAYLAHRQGRLALSATSPEAGAPEVDGDRRRTR